MKKRNLILLMVFIQILAILSAYAAYNIYSGRGGNASANMQNDANNSISAENSTNGEFVLVVNDSEIVIKNLTISMSGLTTDEKIDRLNDLTGKLLSYGWLSDGEAMQIKNEINREYLQLQEKSDYHLIPAKIVIGNQSIKIINGNDYQTIEMSKKTLASFPSYDIEGINEINFGETPINSKTGQRFPMYYLNGRITIIPKNATNWIMENGDTFPQKLAHEVGHNIIDREIADTADLERFSVLHNNASGPENFLTKYAKEEGFKEDLSESVSFWRGNTKLFCKISRRNSVMQEKFLITAKQFCRNNLCAAYISSKDEPIGNFTARENSYRGLFWYDLGSQSIKIENLENFDEFAEKLNCQ